MRARFRTPPINLVSEYRVHHARSQRPQSHLGFLDTAIAACEVEDDPVTKDTGQPADETTNQRRDVYEAGLAIGEIVGSRGEDLGDCCVGDDAGGAAEGED